MKTFRCLPSLLLVLILAAPGIVRAQMPLPPDASISLAGLEQLALTHNPTLCQAAMRVDAARGQCEQAGLCPNPTIGYSGEEMGDLNTAGKQGAFLSQEIVTGGKRRLSQATASHDVHRAQHAWQAQRQRVLTDVRMAFYEVLAAQRTIDVNEQLVRIGEEGLHIAESLMKAKEVARTDVLQAKVEMETARLQLQNARNRHQAAWRRLAAIVGMPELQPAPLAGQLEDDLPQWNWDAALARLLADSPQLAAAQETVQRARCNVERQYAQRVPNIDLRVAAHHDNETGSNIGSVEVGLPVPLFDRNQGNIRTAEAQLIAAQHEVRRLELDLQERLAATFEQYANAQQQTQKYAADILPNAKASLELMRKGCQQGELTCQNLLISQRTYFQVSLAYLESLRQLRSSAVAIDGLLLTGGLQNAEGDKGE